jgi:hypothetical protein
MNSAEPKESRTSLLYLAILIAVLLVGYGPYLAPLGAMLESKAFGATVQPDAAAAHTKVYAPGKVNTVRIANPVDCQAHVWFVVPGAQKPFMSFKVQPHRTAIRKVFDPTITWFVACGGALSAGNLDVP